MRDPRILILDDSLSAVDTHTEAKILSHLRRSTAGRTTLIVSHRISTIKDADLIVVGYRYKNRLTRWWAEGEEATLLTRVSCSILVCMDHP